MGFIFHPYDPPPLLHGLVRRSFYARGHIPYRTDKIIPNGVVSLLFTLGGPHRVGKSAAEKENEEFHHSWLSGLQTTPLYHTPLAGTHVLGILFEPPGLFALFGTNMEKLRDTSVDAREVLPREFIDVVEKQFAEPDEMVSHDKLFRYLQAVERGSGTNWVRDFHLEIVARKGAVSIDYWYEKSGHSSRHSTNLFRRATGVTPKLLCRIHRLIALLEAIDPAGNVNWTTLAHDFGFFDQPHFNHDFQKLCGLYPSEYLEQRRRDLSQLGKGESVSFAPQR